MPFRQSRRNPRFCSSRIGGWKLSARRPPYLLTGFMVEQRGNRVLPGFRGIFSRSDRDEDEASRVSLTLAGVGGVMVAGSMVLGQEKPARLTGTLILTSGLN